MKTNSYKKISKISVIIPTYCEEFNIERTLMAIKKQKCDIPFEIIVIDGKSIDDTVPIAKHYAQTYIAPQRGKVNQLNYITPKSTGEILIFLDADTIIPETYLQKMYELFEKDPSLLACSVRMKYTNNRNIIFKIGSHRYILTTYAFQNAGSHLYYMLKYWFGYPELAGCNIVVRREIFFRVGGFKDPPKSMGIDKVFSDSILNLIRITGYGKIKTLTTMSVLTDARKVSIKRGFKRWYNYASKYKTYSELTAKGFRK